jgi:hypothetical protein
MNNRSKYELASPEVQEVMNKPPHGLLLWGNTFILLIIALCLVLLNTITVPTIKNNGKGRVLMERITVFERVLQQFKRK